MPRTTVSILKFVGTVSLGLLTGISYTASTQSIPALLSLPSASQAQSSYVHHRASTIRQLDRILATAVTSYGLAFALSPRHLRHPYLLWCSLVALIGWETATWMWKRAGGDANLGIGPNRRVVASAREEEEGYVDASTAAASHADLTNSGFGLYDHEASESVILNGEEIRRGMERWRIVEGWRAGLSGFAFLMGVVGIWGDGLGTSVAVVGSV